MYKLCKTEQSARRQRELENGLLEAMLFQRYEDISVSSLCDQLGVPRKAFYRYFESKDGALHALVDHKLMEYELSAQPVKLNSLPGIEVDFPYYFSFWQSQKKLLDALERSNLSGILVQRAISYYQKVRYPELIEKGYSWEYQHYATSFIVTGLMTMVIQWHHDGYKESAQEMAYMAKRIMEGPLLELH